MQCQKCNIPQSSPAAPLSTIKTRDSESQGQELRSSNTQPWSTTQKFTDTVTKLP